jgi:hypothetical protein
VAIGIDLGATLVNDQGQALAEARALTNAKAGVEAVLSRIAEVVGELLAQAPKLTNEPVEGVGIGTPDRDRS